LKEFSVIAILTSIDIYLKYFFSTFTLKPYSFLPFLDLYVTENRGIALSMLDNLNGGMHFLLSIIIFFVLVFLISQYLRSKDRFQKFAIIIIFSGGLGNFLERMYHGYVTDYLHLNINNFSLFVFNFADALITLGAIIMVFTIFKNNEKRIS
jgi:signal peptidase II